METQMAQAYQDHIGMMVLVCQQVINEGAPVGQN